MPQDYQISVKMGTGSIPTRALPSAAYTFTKGIDIVNPGTITAIVWRSAVGATVSAVRAYRVGGTGANVTARKNGTLSLLGTPIALTTAGSWIAGSPLQNKSFSVGNKLEIIIRGTTGSPYQIGAQVEFSQP